MCVLKRIFGVRIAAFEYVDKQLCERQGKVFGVNLIRWSSESHLFLMLFELFVPRSLHLFLFFRDYLSPSWWILKTMSQAIVLGH